MKQTNEQHVKVFGISDTHVKESIILKGIATSINAMSFPKFQNLKEMLLHFDYTLITSDDARINEEIKKNSHAIDKSDTIELLKVNRHIIEYARKRMFDTPDGNLVTMYTPEEKMLMFIDNAISSYINEDRNSNKTEIEEDIVDNIRMLSTFISNHPKIGVCWLPIFKHLGCSYNIETQKFEKFNDVIHFLSNLQRDCCVYTIMFVPDEGFNQGTYTYILRYTYIDKHLKTPETIQEIISVPENK